MDIKELKNKIEDGDIDNSFKVFVIEDESSRIITHQYIDEISKLFDLKVKLIDDLKEIPDDSFVIDDNLYVINVDKWESDKKHNNAIVVCKSTKDKEAIKIPKLEEWQVVDYVIPKLSGIIKQDIEELIKRYDGRYMLFLNDMDKIAVFSPASQNIMLNQMLDDGMFDSITNLKIWDLTNAILKRDTKTVREVLSKYDYIDIEPLGVITLMYKGFKQIANIQLNPKCTLAESGCKSDKQLWFYRKNMCNYYSKEQLIDILGMLTSLEYKFKYEDLPLNKTMVDYIICKILGE